MDERYEKALERAKSAIKECGDNKGRISMIESIFPELKEFGDEKIRSFLIDYIKVCHWTEKKDQGWPLREECIAWLEKQKSVGEIVERCKTSWYNEGKIQGQIEGLSDEEKYQQALEKQGEQILANSAKNCKSEQELSDNIEPKFKVGDWILYSGDHYEGVRHITKIDENGYYIERNGLPHGIIPFNHEICMRLWNIQDAKDGDVLSYVTDEEDLWIMIYWSLYEPYEGHVHYHALLVNDNFSDKGTCCICIDNLKPATKEQRDLLFQKMKDAGYKWNVEKRELKKIEPDTCHTQLTEFEDAIKDMMNAYRDALGKDDVTVEEVKKHSAYLQSLISQNPAWSKDDEQYLLVCKNALRKYEVTNKWDSNIISQWLDEKLKSLRIQNHWKPSEKQINAWSEKDEVGWTNTMIMIKEVASNHYTKDSVKLVIDWLKSLKYKCIWKPTKEHVKAVRLARSFVTDDFGEHPMLSETLIDLEEQLKKLREE